jgi:hypothetical protein
MLGRMLGRALGAVLVAFALFAALEGTAAFLLSNPELLPDAALPVFRRYYRTSEWRNMQLDPECAVYDAELTYRLRPGRFRFAAREFDNAYAVSSVGVRCDARALERPQVIVLGDSHTAGWGVEQNETFVHGLAQRTGLRVLGAAVPSYGTVRELRLLARLDTSALEVLVVQYCENDYRENESWVEGGGHLSIRSRATMESMSATHLAATRYFFGRHVQGLFDALRRSTDDTTGLPGYLGEDHEDDARLFVDVLAGSSVDLGDVRIVVLQLNGNNGNDRPFLDRLEAERAREGLPEPVRELVTVDVSEVLTPEDYYLLDSHMRPSGHAKVAELLADAVTRAR